MDYKVTSHHCITWYQLCGQGIHVEMYGVTTPTSRHLLPPHLRHAPTRVEVGPGLWARTLAHPGQLARGLYGRGYLYHVQVAASTGWTKKRAFSKNENRPWWGFFEKKIHDQ